jgi:hypothetical protein
LMGLNWFLWVLMDRHPKKKVKQEILDKIPELLSKIEQGFDLTSQGLLPSITRTKSLLSIAWHRCNPSSRTWTTQSGSWRGRNQKWIYHSNPWVRRCSLKWPQWGQHDERNPVRDEGSTHGSHGYAQRSIEGADLCVGWGADFAISESWGGHRWRHSWRMLYWLSRFL